MEDKKLFKEIQNNIDSIEIFDTHEHLMYETERRNKSMDFFHLFKHYASTDLISSGLAEKDFENLQDPSVNLEKKWKLFKPYWDNIKNTTYARIIICALKDIYNVEAIDLESVHKVTQLMQKNKKTSFYEKILKNKSNIGYILNDLEVLDQQDILQTEPDTDYFLPVFRPDRILETNSLQALSWVEEKYGCSIYDLKDIIMLIDRIIEERKIFGIKIGLAYSRDISFEDVSYTEAEKNFLKIFKLNKSTSSQDTLSFSDIKPFQDYMVHYCIKKAIDSDLPVQVHTGLIESNLNDIRNSDPSYLAPLVTKYRRARFDIFHAGYPYTGKLIAMLKMYPNCYFNLCWLAEVSTKLYSNILDSVIEFLPSNKIFGFGGDYMFVEGAYGAQKNARSAISTVLYNRIRQGYFDFGEAVEFAEKILNKNPKQIYVS